MFFRLYYEMSASTERAPSLFNYYKAINNYYNYACLAPAFFSVVGDGSTTIYSLYTHIIIHAFIWYWKPSHVVVSHGSIICNS